MADPAMPKLDFKMLIVPGILFLSRNVDMKNPEIVDKMRMGFTAGNLDIFTDLFCGLS